ncbi:MULTISPECIES: phosphomevalonate kinase [unclassified Ligilactobacillus]|uniref:phosphomevalonate kinase n=1 Tax=unclassified Ligilactobacillus TaxID=2767920 RepID=UPI0038520C9F
MITATAPGKLYIAGEYAVVTPGYPAILVAVDRTVTVTLTPTQTTTGTITSDQNKNAYVTWQTTPVKTIITTPTSHPFPYVTAALEVVLRLAREQGKKIRPANLHVTSSLDDAAGKKYGLGSSAAVTVATVKAAARYYHLALTRTTTFKLAAVAAYRVQGNGSLGDVAASTYGGWLAYQSCDREWLMKTANHVSISQLITMKWPHLKITSLTPPPALQLLVGWTGTPASTANFVTQMDHYRVKNAYRQFLTASRQCVTTMIRAFQAGNLPAIQQQLAVNRTLLTELAAASGINIETPALTQLVEIAHRFGAQAKSSGAGGGDCGIAIADRQAPDTPQITAAWQTAGITPLTLHVYAEEEHQ